MIERYSTPEMTAIWTDEARMAAWLQVELAVCEAWTRLGKIPEDALAEIKAKARSTSTACARSSRPRSTTSSPL